MTTWFEQEYETVPAEAGESWGNPFGAAGESWSSFTETATAPEAWAHAEEEAEAAGGPRWESAFASTEQLDAGETEAWAAHETEGAFGESLAPTTPSCGADVTYKNRRWGFATKRCNTPDGEIRRDPLPRSDALELRLTDFCVDDYKLRKRHRDALTALAKDLALGLRSGRYLKGIRVRILGEASSTASVQHNITLSEHRAFNTAFALRCTLDQEAVPADAVNIAWAATGEWRADQETGDNVENPSFRGVLVKVLAPVATQPCPPVVPCNCPKPPWRPPPPPPPGRTTTNLCVTIPSIAPRSASKLPPDLIPLGSIVPGLALPMALVTNARAAVRVQSPGRTTTLDFRGWGLEVNLPTRAGVDLRVALRASLDAVVRAAGSLSGRLSLGPLQLALRLDAAALARLVVRLSAELRLHLDAGFTPSRPELTACPPLRAIGSFEPSRLAGPASLVVPGRGLGPAQVRFSAPAVMSGALRLSTNPIPAPADKATIRTALVVGGALGIAAGAREAELEGEPSWEALQEWEALSAAEAWAEAPLAEGYELEGASIGEW